MNAAKAPNSPNLTAVSSPDKAQKAKEGRSPDAIVRFVSAYLDTLPSSAKRTWPEAMQAFGQLIERWRDSDLHPKKCQPELMEAGTEIAFRYDMPVGDLLTALTRRLQAGEKHADLKVASTDDRILEAAYAVFAEKGFYTATVDEIAAAAGVGKGTVYRHFDSKDKLFQEVVRLKLDDLVAQIREAFESAEDVLQGIRRAVLVYLKFFETHKTFYRILIFEQQGYGTGFRTEYIAGILQNAPVIREMVLDAAVNGVTKPLDDFYTIFYGLIGFVDGVIHKWFYNNCEGNLEDELDTIVEVLFYGFVKQPKPRPNGNGHSNGQNNASGQPHP